MPLNHQSDKHIRGKSRPPKETMKNMARPEQRGTRFKKLTFGFHIAMLVIMSLLTSCVPAVSSVASPAPSPAIDVDAIYTLSITHK